LAFGDAVAIALDPMPEAASLVLLTDDVGDTFELTKGPTYLFGPNPLPVLEGPRQSAHGFSFVLPELSPHASSLTLHISPWAIAAHACPFAACTASDVGDHLARGNTISVRVPLPVE
jgi:hypothetical protein